MARGDTHIEFAFNDEVGLNLLGYRWASRDHSGAATDHRSWDLIHITEGEASAHYGGKRHDAPCGATLLFDPFSSYRIDSGPAAVSYLYARFTFHFDPARSVRSDLRLPVLHATDVDGVGDRIRRIAGEVHARRDADLAAYRKQMHEVVLGLVHAITTPTPQHEPADGFVRRIQTFLAHNAHGPLSMQQVAKVFSSPPATSHDASSTPPARPSSSTTTSSA